MLKNIMKKPWFINIIGFIISLLLRIIYFSMKWDKTEKNLLREYSNQRVILVFWHGRMLMMPFLWKNPKNMYVLISHHKDGEIIAKAIQFLGYKTIRGSSSKGGVGALKNILRVLEHSSVAITPDGPRGPVQKIGGNLAAIARITKAPVILSVYSADKRKILGSWDKMIIPKLFSKGAFTISEPIYFGPEDTEESFTHRLETRINNMLNAVDKR